MTQEPSVQIEEIVSALPNGQLWGSFRVKSAEGSRLELIGWALAKSAEVEAVEIVAAGTVVAATKPSLVREELAKEFPDRESAGTAGFEVAIEAHGKGPSKLQLRAVLDDGTEAPMGEVRVLAPARRWSNIFRRA